MWCGGVEIDELMEVTICRLTVLMATLRSGKKLDSNDNNNETAEEKGERKVVKDRTTLVVFFGLLIDLLGDLLKILEEVFLMLIFQPLP